MTVIFVWVNFHIFNNTLVSNAVCLITAWYGRDRQNMFSLQRSNLICVKFTQCDNCVLDN